MSIPVNFQCVEFALGDLDRDGDLDLVSINDGSNPMVLRNDGSGFLSEVDRIGPQALRGYEVELGDLDGDGDLDVIIGGNSPASGSIQLGINDGTGLFTDLQVPLGGGTLGIAVADVDGDGDLDIVAPRYGGSSPLESQILVNDGQANFNLVSSLEGTTRDVYDVAAGDINGDGDVDLVSCPVLGTAVRVWEGSLSGTWGSAGFQQQSELTPAITTDRVCVADFDGDGDLDTLSASQHSSNLVFLNDGSGSLTLHQTLVSTSGAYDAITGDLDGDGDVDIVTLQTGGTQVWRNDGTGTFTDTGQSLGASAFWAGVAALGDADGDGDLDLFTVTLQPRLWRNNGSGVFTEVVGAFVATGGSPAGIRIGDLDRDGDLDVVLRRQSGLTTRIFLNDGAGAFTLSVNTIPTATTLAAAVLADIDKDGDLDLVEGAPAGTNASIYLNDGNASFTTSANTFGGEDHTRHSTVGDFDRDGDLDIAMGGRGVNPSVYVYFNDGSGAFPTRQVYAGITGIQGVAAGDLDRDGDLDLLLGIFGREKVYTNR